MPPEDHSQAFTRFQMNTETTKWPAENGGTIEFCPCLTCRAEAVRRMIKGNAWANVGMQAKSYSNRPQPGS